MNKIELLLTDKIKMFEDWEQEELYKIEELKESIQHANDSIKKSELSIASKSKEVEFFRDLMLAIKQDAEEKTKAASIYIESIDDDEVKANAKTFCETISIISVKSADEENKKEKVTPIASSA